MLENMTQDKRVLLAERICDLFVECEANTQEAIAAIHLVTDLMNSSGLAIVKSRSEGQDRVCAEEGPEGAGLSLSPL